MRGLLFIPVLILFLSNVPFVQHIPMEQVIEMMQENGGCGKHQACSRETENLETSCGIEESGCEQACTNEPTTEDNTEDNCCQQTETTCVCIVCFQYAAPVNSITEYLFYNLSLTTKGQDYLIGHIKDPHIGAPWQPPDLV